MASETVTRSDVANWSPIEGANEGIRKYTQQVRDQAETLLDRRSRFKRFDAVSCRSGTPGGPTGDVWYAVKVDIGEGDSKFIHIMVSVQVIQKATAKLERCALYFKKDAPVEAF